MNIIAWSRRAGTLGTAICVVASVAGCGIGGAPTRPLTADAFVRNRPAENIGNPVDRPGPLLYDTARVPLGPGGQQASAPVNHIGSVVSEGVRPPSAEATQPSTRPAQAAASATQPPLVQLSPAGSGSELSGRYLNLGAVLMEVNGQPIFTNKVLKDLELPLAAEAKKRPLEQFKEISRILLENQVNLYKREELEFAAAQRTMSKEDEAVARALTTQWRQKKITDAGGSLEQAKRNAAAEGNNFEDLVNRQYRLFVIQIFYQKHVIPLIQVAASDIRSYYNTHRDSEFTTHGAARFRVIKIDSRSSKYFAREDAYNKAQELRKKALAGDDFAQLANQVNEDASLKGSGGYVVPGGWVDEGAYAIDEVNKALDHMKPGDVSDIIPVNGVYYIVKLEDIRRGGVQPFEDLAVQDKIRDKLRAQQFSALRDKHVAELERDAVTRRNQPMIDEAEAMILQRYQQWARAK